MNQIQRANAKSKTVPDFWEALESIRQGSISAPVLGVLLSAEDEEEMAALCAAADQVRSQTVGDAIHLRAIIEFSSYCRCNCHYCGLRRDNTDLSRYRLRPEQVIERARQVADIGYRTVVLQSGEDPWYECDLLCEIIRVIKKETDLAITLSVGERSREEYRAWKEAGADRYLLKHETADRSLYAKLHPGMSWENRIQCLRWLRELDYQVGSGVIVGLPGQTVDTLVQEILLMRELGIHMAGIGPFIPHARTPLAKIPAGSVSLTLKMLAVTRLAIPELHLPATTALITLDPEGREKALQAGANVVMPNLTPSRFRRLYEIYPNKAAEVREAFQVRREMEKLIESLGRTVARDPGHALKWEERNNRGGIA